MKLPSSLANEGRGNSSSGELSGRTGQPIQGKFKLQGSPMQPTIITRERFASKAWWRHTSFVFASRSHIIPVVVSELSSLVPSMPLGFVKTGESFQLVAITSLQPGTNLFVASDGNWVGDYIPAVVRAYPFRLVKPQGSEDSVLGFDETSDLLVDAGQGEPFFDEDGPSPALKAILSFLSETEASRVQTQRLVDVLQKADLIRPWPLGLQQGGQTVPVQGLYRIDEDVLNALPDEVFHPLRDAGALPLAYAQLFSTNQFGMLPKAVEVQTRMREQLQARAMDQTQGVADMGFELSKGETLKFS